MTQQHRLSVDRLRPTAEAGLAAQRSGRGDEEVLIADEVANILKSEGVEYVFYLTGGGTGTMIVSIQKAGIKAVHCRNEMSAGFALPGAGTGLTNFTTGLCQAYAAQSPGVALIAESGPFDDDKFGSQGVSRAENQCRGMCKWVRKAHPNTLLWQLRRAFRSAVAPPAAPVVVAYGNTEFAPGIKVPRRVAYQALDPDGWKPRTYQSMVDPREIEQLVTWLLEAEKPSVRK